MGLSDEDRQLIQDSGPIILDNSEELTGIIYDNFIKFPYSRKFFLNEQGEVDEVRLERRKHTLGRWFRGTISFTMDESFAVAALATGISHSHPPSHRAHLGAHSRPPDGGHHVLYPNGGGGAAVPGDGRPQDGRKDQRSVEQAPHAAIGHTPGRLYERANGLALLAGGMAPIRLTPAIALSRMVP